MADFKDIQDLIKLDGGVVSGPGNFRKFGWSFRMPTRDEIDEIEKKYGLDYWDRHLIVKYAGASCFKLNLGLRGGREKDEFCIKYESLLNKSLDQLESYDNQIVYRWLSIPDEAFHFLKKKVGLKVLVPNFLSTSNYKNKGYSTFYKISTTKNSNGYYIGDIVEKQSEKEILFKSNTVFQITGFDGDSIYMDEIKSHDYDLILSERFWNK